MQSGIPMFGMGNPSAALTVENVQDAAETWGFNCGPGALCGLLGKSPDEIRPFLGDFETKRYTNPTLMNEILDRLGIPFELVYRNDSLDPDLNPPDYGLIRIQWDGPWTKPGVPMAARYRKTHWIGYRSDTEEIFDINCINIGGWVPFVKWSECVVPWILEQCVPKANGQWWPTHCLDFNWGSTL